MTSADAIVQLRQVSKWYGNFQALKGISMSARRGKVHVLCGPSGSGKSTVLRCINGLEPINGGEILIQNVQVPTRRSELRKLRATIGIVFQSFNLFPHFTVLQNLILAPVKVLKLSRAEAEGRAETLLAQVGIPEKLNAFPHELSGGQQQRVAIARALCMQPEIMLFDEPTSALDPEMIQEVLDVIRDLARRGMTMIIVSHEMGFAREVADRISLLDDGTVVEEASPETFFTAPGEERTKRFLSRLIAH